MHVDAIDRWTELLGDIGALGAALSSAIEQGDVIGAISAMMQLRRSRSELSRVEGPGHASDTDRTRLDHLATLTVGARSAEAVVRAWRARPLPGDATLLATPLGTAVLADALLPEVWDFETDLVVLVGDGLEAAATVLADLGQRRMAILSGTSSLAGVVAVTSSDELAAALRTMVPNPPRQVVLRGVLGVPAEELARISEVMRATLSDLRIHRNTVNAFSRTWIAQTMENLPALARWPSVAAVGDRLAGVPMVIVAPGPSLARNIDQLRALEGRALVTAFSHSLKPVLAAGLRPDLILTVDPQDVRYHFAGCDVSASYLVSAATAHPSLFELPGRGCLALSANSAIDDWIFAAAGEDAVIPGGGSVATSALSLALRWGCDPIIFVGLDLSFPGGQYYVSTSSDGQARAEVDASGVMRVAGWSDGFRAMKAGGGPQAVGERAIELPAWGGEGTVPSSFMFSMFHRWFVERLSASVYGTVFNCTEGGAHIPGMVHQPLAEVLASLPPRPSPRVVLDEVVAACDASRRGKAFAGAYGRYLDTMRRCRRLAERARHLIRAGTPGPELARTERALVAGLAHLEFLSLVAQREVEVASDVAMRAGTEDTYLEASDRLFAALISVIDEVTPQLRRALGRLTKMYGRAA